MVKRDWAKNNTIIVIQEINTVLYDKSLFRTTRWQRKTTNGLIKPSRYRCSPETCKWEELTTRAASGRGLGTARGRSLCQEQQVGGAWEPHVGGAYAKNSKWEELMPLA